MAPPIFSRAVFEKYLNTAETVIQTAAFYVAACNISQSDECENS